MKNRTIFDLLLFKTSANLKTEVSQYYLNYLWWVIEPILEMGIFYIIFGIFLNSGTEHFVAFLLCGICFWQWFQRTVMNASMSILGGQGLMMQVHIPKFFFPLEVVLLDSFKQLFVVCLLLIFLFFYPTGISIKWLYLPLLMFIQLILVTGFALLTAAIVPFLPDLKFVISSLIQLLFFASGVFFEIDSVVLPEHRNIIYLNPIAGLIKFYRNILIYNEPIDMVYLLKVLIFSVSIFIIAMGIIIKLDRLYPRICQK